MTGKEGKVRVTARWLGENYEKREVMVPMRDGVKLYTSVYEPIGSFVGNVGRVNGLNDEDGVGRMNDRSDGDGTGRGPGHPVLIVRTPFSLKPYGKGFRRHLREDMRNFAANGYIVVFQNVRGTYLSEGRFENIRPLKSVSGSETDEATDTWDTVEWILHNTCNNGNVGVRGMSYPGFYASMAALSNHPAIKAVSPQAPVTDWFMGDDTHHKGAFMLADMYQFGASFFRRKTRPMPRRLPTLAKVDMDTYDFFLEKGSMKEILSPFDGDRFDFWDEIKEHKDYDDFWKDRNPAGHFRSIKPAMLFVGGTFDAEDAYGPLECYRRMKAKSPDTETYMVLGPWCHGGWYFKEYDHMDGSAFGNGLSDWFLDEVEYPFFAWYLEGKGAKPESEVIALPSYARRYVYKGKRRFFPEIQKYGCWPPARTRMERLYLSDNKRLSPDGPEETGRVCRIVSDPKDPVPYYHKDSQWRLADYMAGDQRFLMHRDDVLTFSGDALKRPLKLAGPVKVSLRIETDATDLDIVVKLIDERPDGYQMLVRGEVMPARYRGGFERPEPLVPGEETEISFTMNDIDHVVLSGHRLLVQVQCSWFPVVAMNPQSFVDNPYLAGPEDYKKAEIRVLCRKSAASYIEIPVLGKA